MSEAPEKYWHCQIKLRGAKGRDYSVINDLSFSELEKRILLPWKTERTFSGEGQLFAGTKDVELIRISQTDEPLQVWERRHDAEMDAANVMDLATDQRLIPVKEGRDWADELLFTSSPTAAMLPPAPDVAMVKRLCERILFSAQVLANRRSGKRPFAIKDEYDVQELLHAVLRAYIGSSIRENPLSKTAGTTSARADIAIADLGTLIELKFARKASDQAKIVDDFGRDLTLYPKWPELRTLFYVIYNSSVLPDREHLKELSGEKLVSGKHFQVEIVLA